MKRFRMSKTIKTVVVILLTVGMIAAGIGAYWTYNNPSVKEEEITVFEQTWTEEVHWLSELYPNRMFAHSFLENDDYIFRELTKAVGVLYDVRYSADRPVHMEGTTSLTGYLEARYGEEDEVLWKRTYELKGPETFRFDGHTYHFKANDAVTLTYFKDWLTALDSEFNVGTDYIYKMVYEIDGIATVDGQEHVFNVSPTLEIPFMDSVGVNTPILTEEPIYTVSNTLRTVMPVNMTLYYILITIGVICLICLIFVLSLVRTLPAKDEFDRFVINLIREHEDRMVKMPSALSLQNDLVMTMTCVEDMVKAADELSQPIFYYLIDEAEERKVELYVFDDVRIYYFAKLGELKVEEMRMDLEFEGE